MVAGHHAQVDVQSARAKLGCLRVLSSSESGQGCTLGIVNVLVEAAGQTQDVPTVHVVLEGQVSGGATWA